MGSDFLTHTRLQAAGEPQHARDLRECEWPY